jgi:hypothetical protein
LYLPLRCTQVHRLPVLFLPAQTVFIMGNIHRAGCRSSGSSSPADPLEHTLTPFGRALALAKAVAALGGQQRSISPAAQSRSGRQQRETVSDAEPGADPTNGTIRSVRPQCKGPKRKQSKPPQGFRSQLRGHPEYHQRNGRSR